MRHRRTVWGLLILLAAGCSHEPEPLVEVRGQVLFKGKPLPGGTIVFVPDLSRGNSGPLAKGEIQPDGHYRLFTDGRPGAVLGWHRVTVAGAPTPAAALPTQYRDPESSRQSQEVKEMPLNTIDIHLE